MIRYKYHVDIVLAVVQEYLAGLILLSDEVSFLLLSLKEFFRTRSFSF